MMLFTKKIIEQLQNNAAKNRNDDMDMIPAVKIFDPCGAATWLFTEIMPDGALYGLCDLGLGMPELGYASREELEGAKNCLGLQLERDRQFQSKLTLSEHAKLARTHSRIMA